MAKWEAVSHKVLRNSHCKSKHRYGFDECERKSYCNLDTSTIFDLIITPISRTLSTQITETSPLSPLSFVLRKLLQRKT